jgi:hypothetical protein
MRAAALVPQLALLALTALATPGAAASNTTTTRSFTSEWLCDNGRSLLVNAHPAPLDEDAWLTYAGKRVEVSLQAGAQQGASKDGAQRFASKDGKVVWARLKESSMLQFAVEPSQPVTCKLKTSTQPKK